MAEFSTDKAVFQVTPAPSEQNQSKEIWNTYLNDSVDELNVVNMKTNTLLGTIGGGNSDYRFYKQPISNFATTSYDSAVIGQAKIITSSLNITYFCKLDNDIILSCDIYPGLNHFNNGIFTLIGTNFEDSNDKYFVAFKVNENDKSLLEKIAEVQIPPSSFINTLGYNYTYQPQDVDNECYFIYHVYPTSDSQLLETEQIKLTIAESNGTYTLSLEEISYNYGGKTVLELYNENAPSPVSGVDWIYRSPFNSIEDNSTSILNGRDEGWVWYGNYNSGKSTLYPYLAGFNIVTGETAYIEPIASLSATTNFNPLGTVDFNYFSVLWQSHPAGVYFAVDNKQSLDNGDNTNSVTALYSPRWVNNDKVTFINIRDYEGNFLNTDGKVNDPFAFDSENIVCFYLNTLNATTGILIQRFKLDSSEKLQEIKVIPMINALGFNYVGHSNNFPVIYINNEQISLDTYGLLSLICWQKDNTDIYLLQTNILSTWFGNISFIANNKIYSVPTIGTPLGIEYDEYKKVIL